MEIPKKILFLTALAVSFAAAGCSRSKTERDANERARLELEEKSRREAETANKAITHMNQKLGRKPPSLDLGLPSETKTTTPSPEASKP